MAFDPTDYRVKYRTKYRKPKFMDVVGQSSGKDVYYEFPVTRCAFDGTFIAANGKFIAFCVEDSRGSGAFAVLTVKKKGRQGMNILKIRAHEEYVLDLQWDPFNDTVIASCSEDGSIKIWEIPENGIEIKDWDNDDGLLLCMRHHKRCVQIAWHPIASWVLLSVSQEPKMCVWDLNGCMGAKFEIVPQTEIWNAAWSMKGDKIITSCKDTKFRIYNARTGDLIKVGYPDNNAQKVIFIFNDKYLFSCGFTYTDKREFRIWNADTMIMMNCAAINTPNGCLIPYYDPDTQIVYVSGRGDSGIGYFTLVEEWPHFHYVSTFESNIQPNLPQIGLAPLPKRNCIVDNCEVARFYKLHDWKTDNGLIEPISFTVPRKTYQDDLYTDAVSEVAALEADEWFEGKDAVSEESGESEEEEG